MNHLVGCTPRDMRNWRLDLMAFDTMPLAAGFFIRQTEECAAFSTETNVRFYLMEHSLLDWIANEELLNNLVAGFPTWGLLLAMAVCIFVLSKGADYMIDGAANLALKTGDAAHCHRRNHYLVGHHHARDVCERLGSLDRKPRLGSGQRRGIHYLRHRAHLRAHVPHQPHTGKALHIEPHRFGSGGGGNFIGAAGAFCQVGGALPSPSWNVGWGSCF